MCMHREIQWLTGHDRGVNREQGLTVTHIHGMYTGAVYRDVQGIQRMTEGAQGMTGKTQGVTREDRGFSYGRGFLKSVVLGITCPPLNPLIGVRVIFMRNI